MEALLDTPVQELAGAPCGPSAGGLETSATDTDEHIRASLELLSELYNYSHWIFNKIRPFVRGRVCEVGCGIGNITQFLLKYDMVVGIEPQAEMFRETQARFSQHLNTRFLRQYLDDCPNEDVPNGFFDTVVCLNVLEHIADDVDALKRMKQLCNQRGRVIILVPAHMSIYGQLDHSFGHYRRYSRQHLRRVFEAAGLQPIHSLYMNSLGYFGWLWQSRILKRREITVRSGRFFDRLVPFLDAFERVFRPPFGQSLAMIGTPL